jgi:ATP-dependent DNA helicase RecG
MFGYVNRFNRGINMVQEILEENKNGQAIFDFKDISTFKVTVMNVDPVSENESENGADGAEKLSVREKEILALKKIIIFQEVLSPLNNM